MPELETEDRYQLRKLQMDVEKKGLEVQKAQQELDRLVLELERKYDLLGEAGSIDLKTGSIVGNTPTQSRNGKSRTEPLLAAVAEEAA